MMCSFKDLVRLQFWVLAVIILGFLEKTFFVAEYSAINLGNEGEELVTCIVILPVLTVAQYSARR